MPASPEAAASSLSPASASSAAAAAPSGSSTAAILTAASVSAGSEEKREEKKEEIKVTDPRPEMQSDMQRQINNLESKNVSYIKNSVKFFEKHAKEGDPWCQYYLAQCLFNGIGIKRNRPKAIELFEAAASQSVIWKDESKNKDIDAKQTLIDIYGGGYYPDNPSLDDNPLKIKSPAMAKAWKEYESTASHESKMISLPADITNGSGVFEKVNNLEIFNQLPALKILLLAYRDLLIKLDRFDACNISGIINGFLQNTFFSLNAITPKKVTQRDLEECYKKLIDYSETNLSTIFPKKLFSENENLKFIKNAVKVSKNPPLANYINEIWGYAKLNPEDIALHKLLNGLIAEVIRLYNKPDQELHSKDKAFRICQEITRLLRNEKDRAEEQIGEKKDKEPEYNFYKVLCDNVFKKGELKSSLRYATSGFNQGLETNSTAFKNITKLIAEIDKERKLRSQPLRHSSSSRRP